jgi:nucleolar MIF4G domain-containing protein 1
MDDLMDEQDSSEEESDEDAEVIAEDDIDSDELEQNDETSEEEEKGEEEIKASSTQQQSKANVLTKYVPPHLRKAATGKSELQLKLQKQLQGQLNRLSESNMESILLEIEKCYGTYPRHGKLLVQLYQNTVLM